MSEGHRVERVENELLCRADLNTFELIMMIRIGVDGTDANERDADLACNSSIEKIEEEQRR
jgi:hypothetical protein